jgi:pimeloyl-ACP methyl ester carboxylesterase
VGTLPTITDNQIKLRDGRTLGYAEFGVPTGRPVFLFNGTASRLFYPMDVSVASALNARIITVDRPGIGLSDFKPGRTLLDWPDDVQELADTLGIEKFAVAGGSAGGPYAAVCAFKLPERLTALALISSLAPFDIPEITNGMTPAYRMIPVIAQRAPWLLSLSQAFMIRNPEGAWKQFYNRLPECDRAILQQHPNLDMKAVLMNDLSEIYRHGPQGVVWDVQVLTRPWGFNPAEIKAKTYLWQGEQDVNVPPTMGRYLARKIPNCQAWFISDEGHLTYLNRWQEIVSVLVN